MEERLCQIHTLYFPEVEYVDAMTTVWLLDQRLGQLANLTEAPASQRPSQPQRVGTDKPSLPADASTPDPTPEGESA